VCAVRGGRCAAGWLSVRAARCTVCGLFAMQCAAMHGMRYTGCDAMRCDARRHAFDGGIFRVVITF
jgi:hypothetical protein